ncbi:GNAT family N-acetyltransferase [Nibribacter ruber]|uniref:GNAT family N-acetyltransferase n=1 Tax=Nibribacter ruber TaxID=2698458 RepID=A0A6P1P179_9BACT|nr:GNAT family N-acetyltransferase [Nibribacter ruber]QHL87323.1 GNAT family N-acetyltransferase [Nibribacter ruber]
MTLDIKHDKENQQFTAFLEDQEIGELAYALPEDGVMDFQHTFIEQEYRGKGLADQLIQHGLDHAKNNGFKIVATCTAVAKYLERHQQA